MATQHGPEQRCIIANSVPAGCTRPHLLLEPPHGTVRSLNLERTFSQPIVETYWSAASIGDRVDYWISADNGTHWEEVESESTIHFDYPGKELVKGPTHRLVGRFMVD